MRKYLAGLTFSDRVKQSKKRFYNIQLIIVIQRGSHNNITDLIHFVLYKVACVASVSVRSVRSKELPREKREGRARGRKETLVDKSWILKTAHFAFHA